MEIPIAEIAFSHDASCPVTVVVSLSDGSLVLSMKRKDNDKAVASSIPNPVFFCTVV
jgi:hypothetical protein